MSGDAGMSGCMVNLNAATGTPGVNVCQRPAIYRAQIADCSACRASDFPRCIGHPVCVTHGAELRADDERLKDEGKPAELQRIRSLT